MLSPIVNDFDGKEANDARLWLLVLLFGSVAFKFPGMAVFVRVRLGSIDTLSALSPLARTARH